MDAFEGYDEFYYSNVCHVCKICKRRLFACSSCKVYRYCSKQHQIVHWPRHKKVCEALSQINASTNGKKHAIQTDDDWTRKRLAIKDALEKKLSRPLTSSETQMWMFPRSCEFCHETDSSTLYDCARCPSASFCSKAHEISSDHPQTCHQLRLQYGHYFRLFREPAARDPFPAATVELDILENLFTNRNIEASQLTISLGEKFSHSFTLLEAMRKAGLLNGLISTKEKLTIHIVGATHEYLNFDRSICSSLFRWISNLHEISIIFIGPEVQIFQEDNEESSSLECESDNKVHYEFKPVLYSQYVSCQDFVPPDIIAAFNCGFHEFSNSIKDTWSESLPLLLFPGVPLLFTSYTLGEAYLDFKLFTTTCAITDSVHHLICHQENQFRGLLPLRDWININEFYFINHYYSMIRLS